MRKTILIILLIFNVFNTFSQVQEEMIDKMIELANNNKGEEAKIIALDLLNLKYGAITNESNFFAQYSISDYYYGKRKYKIGLHYFNNLLEFAEKNELTIQDKKQLLKDIKSKVKDLKDFLPDDSTSDELVLAEIKRNNNTDINFTQTTISNKTSETNSINRNMASDNSNIQADKKETNTDKTVTLTVSGTGKTLEEARLNALRSAIEQAFGAFISSKTEILNDNLVKDEIVSIANGNVQKYDVVSQVELPNAGYAITLSATVSIDRLTSFAESRGVVVEFKGGMFGATIKLQKLNEESEYIAIKNLLVQTLTILESTYDYSLKVNEPKLIENDKYSILFEVSATKNDNFDNLWNFFKKTISKISLNEVDALAIENTGKKIWYLKVDDEKLKLRNKKSLNLIFNFSMLSSMLVSNSFYLENNLGTVKIKNKKAMLFTSFTGEVYAEGRDIDNVAIMTKPEVIIIKENGIDYNFLDYVKLNNFDIIKLIELKIFTKEYDSVQLWDSKNKISIETPFVFKTEYNEYPNGNKNLQYKINYNLLDLEKIQSFKIQKIPFIKLMNNYASYRE